KQIRSAYPEMKIAGFRNGYFSSKEERQEEIRHIIELNPDFTIVGMGITLQENFALDLRKAGYKGIVFTCGGFLHQTVENINYYPAWINKYNLRAFYRLYKEKGLFKRLYYVLLEFPFLFTYDSLKTKMSHKG
ncbi:MAG: WecB/TagA/CpsF family glycosyltransferase, partial [Muribaculaceae bacterium]|nr:WecB/TagA/CpsF family glycosyltransferase [Muribaculaceae bacterium]